MRLMSVGLLVVLGLSLAHAQDAPLKSVKTLKIQKPSPEAAALYAIEPDGTVKIDWDAVETLVASKADRTMSPVAEVMLAIRERKWKPMR